MGDDFQTERLGFLLNTAGKRVYAITEDVLRDFALTPREFGVLETLAQVAATNQLTLAKRRHIDPATMVALVDRMETEGYLRRMTEVTDRRNRLLRLTEKGAEIVRKAGASLDRAEEQFLSVLDPPDRDLFLAYLERIGR